MSSERWDELQAYLVITVTGALRAAVRKPTAAALEPVPVKKPRKAERTVLIGAHFAPEVRRRSCLCRRSRRTKGET
jgi:hypothetical protein